VRLHLAPLSHHLLQLLLLLLLLLLTLFPSTTTSRAGIEITDEQIKELSDHIMDIDYETAEAKEAETRHDVMAHVHTYGLLCPQVSSNSSTMRW